MAMIVGMVGRRVGFRVAARKGLEAAAAVLQGRGHLAGYRRWRDDGGLLERGRRFAAGLAGPILLAPLLRGPRSEGAQDAEWS